MIFRKFNYSAELSAQRSLFLECFPENSGSQVLSEEHYIWKFHGSNEVPPSYEYCASLDNELIGYYAAINYPYTFFGRNVKAGMVCDVMTGIKARGQGVFAKLGAYAIQNLSEQETAFITGYPIRKEVIPGHRKTGWNFPFQIPMYGKFLSFKSFLRSREKRWAIPLLSPLLSVFNFLTDISRMGSDTVKIERKLVSDLENIAGFEDFLKELQSQTNITLRKDIGFLKWRLGAPGKSYSIVILNVNSKIAGYAIGRFVMKEKVPCFGILEISLLNGFEKYASFLLKELEIIAKEQEAELLLIMIMKTLALKYRFFANGYISTPYKFSFIVKQIDKTVSETELLREENWSLTWLDSDDL